MASYLTPYLVVTGVAAANEFYNTKSPESAIKPLVMGGIATALASLLANIPQMDGVIQGIGWLAFVGLMISPVQKPSPVDNLLKITGQ